MWRKNEELKSKIIQRSPMASPLSWMHMVPQHDELWPLWRRTPASFSISLKNWCDRWLNTEQPIYPQVKNMWNHQKMNLHQKRIPVTQFSQMRLVPMQCQSPSQVNPHLIGHEFAFISFLTLVVVITARHGTSWPPKICDPRSRS